MVLLPWYGSSGRKILKRQARDVAASLSVSESETAHLAMNLADRSRRQEATSCQMLLQKDACTR